MGSFSVAQSELQAAFGVVARIAAKRRETNVVRFDASDGKVTLTADSLDVLAQVRLDAATEGESSFVVPAKFAAITVSHLPDAKVTFTEESDCVMVEAGRSAGSIATLSNRRLGQLRDLGRLEHLESTGSVQADELNAAVAAALVAAGTDQSRPMLTGVHVSAVDGKLTFVATDSYRLHVVESTVDGSLIADGAAVVPAETFQDVAKAMRGAIGVSMSQSEIGFTTGAATIRARLIQGDYPNWRALTATDDSHSVTAIVDRSAFAEALGRSEAVAAVGGLPIPANITFAEPDSTATVVADARDALSATDELDAVVDGGTITIGFNPKFLADAVKACRGDKVEIVAQTPQKPVRVSSVDDRSFSAIVMPVRVS